MAYGRPQKYDHKASLRLSNFRVNAQDVVCAKVHLGRQGLFSVTLSGTVDHINHRCGGPVGSPVQSA
jgi:hypothetical protein